MDDGFMDEQNILDELPMEMLEQHACPSDFSPNLLTQVSNILIHHHGFTCVNSLLKTRCTYTKSCGDLMFE